MWVSWNVGRASASQEDRACRALPRLTNPLFSRGSALQARSSWLQGAGLACDSAAATLIKTVWLLVRAQPAFRTWDRLPLKRVYPGLLTGHSQTSTQSLGAN